MSPILDPGQIVLTSPYLADSVSVIRRQETLTTSGRNTLSPVTTNNVPAIVDVTGDNSLDRPFDGERQKKEIDVYTRFALRGASLDNMNWQPDLVLWHGDQFVVKTTEDWGAYGEGWTKAHCVSEDMTQVPPLTSGRTNA